MPGSDARYGSVALVAPMSQTKSQARMSRVDTGPVFFCQVLESCCHQVWPFV